MLLAYEFGTLLAFAALAMWIFVWRWTSLYDPVADVRVDPTYFQKTPTRR